LVFGLSRKIHGPARARTRPASSGAPVTVTQAVPSGASACGTARKTGKTSEISGFWTRVCRPPSRKRFHPGASAARSEPPVRDSFGREVHSHPAPAAAARLPRELAGFRPATPLAAPGKVTGLRPATRPGHPGDRGFRGISTGRPYPVLLGPRAPTRP